jgi:hypothetical protein
MKLSLDVPADIVRKLEAGWSDLTGHALEALAVQAYRSGLLTAADVQRMVGLESRQDADELLQQRAGARPGLRKAA